VAHIDDFPLLGDPQVVLGILSSCVAHWPFYSTWTNFFSFLYFLVGFNKNIMWICVGIMGLGSWEFLHGLLMKRHVQLLISFGGSGIFFMEDCAPFTFLKSWVLVVLYLCFWLVLEEYVSQVEGGPHLLQSCMCVVWDGLLHVARNMHPYFESLIVTNTLSLHASLMDIHYNTSFKFILDDDSFSSTSRARIYFCSGNRASLWLIVRSFICSFHIAHSISMLHFHFDLIQPSTSSLLTCECEHMSCASFGHSLAFPFCLPLGWF
jgi:hypothetical protein